MLSPCLLNLFRCSLQIVDEVAEGVEALTELDERLRGLNSQALFEQVDS
jgi:hypothetical protein